MRDRSERADHYRKKAELVRAVAESISSLETKQFLVTVEGDYLMLANLLERSRLPDPLPASE